jgi:hypothetical protein
MSRSKYKPNVESSKAKEGKTFYIAMGPSRNFEAVAEHVGVKLPTVRNWSGWYDWLPAASAYDDELQAAALATVKSRAIEEHRRRLRDLPIEQLDKADQLMSTAEKLHQLVEKNLARIIAQEMNLSVKELMAVQRSEREAIALGFRLKYEALGVDRLVQAFLDRQGVQ